jgi:hypothetical protein
MCEREQPAGQSQLPQALCVARVDAAEQPEGHEEYRDADDTDDARYA